MKTKILILFTFASLIVCNSCDKKESEPEFKNEITLGTGLNHANYFELSGVSSEFYSVGGSAIIYFKVESSEDIAGNAILLEFRTMSNGLINSISRPSTQDYGHILISSFEWMWEAGTYKAQAYIVKGDDTQFVAETVFTVH